MRKLARKRQFLLLIVVLLSLIRFRVQTYGLIAPGVEMADILAFNLTQTAHHAPRKMNDPDLSTKLKLMGVDVASFGDFVRLLFRSSRCQF